MSSVHWQLRPRSHATGSVTKRQICQQAALSSQLITQPPNNNCYHVRIVINATRRWDRIVNLTITLGYISSRLSLSFSPSLSPSQIYQKQFNPLLPHAAYRPGCHHYQRSVIAPPTGLLLHHNTFHTITMGYPSKRASPCVMQAAVS